MMESFILETVTDMMLGQTIATDRYQTTTKNLLTTTLLHGLQLSTVEWKTLQHTFLVTRLQQVELM